jgi:hypothetical protein
VEGAGFRHGKGSLGQHLDQAPVGGATWWREQTWEGECGGILHGVHMGVVRGGGMHNVVGGRTPFCLGEGGWGSVLCWELLESE